MNWMFRPSIRRKIVGIAVGLIVLMVLTSAVSAFMAGTVGHLLDELNDKYFPAYNHLAQANIRSLERAIALRRMMIAKMQPEPDEAGYAARLKAYQEADAEVEGETQAARKLINAIIDDPTTPSDNAALARIDDRIENATQETRKQLGEESQQMLRELDEKDYAAARRSMERVDALRDEFSLKIDAIRADMLKQVYASSSIVIRNQRRAMLISVVVTALAATIGLGFALVVSSGITRPVRQLLEGTRHIEAGNLDRPISVSTTDEIGQLSLAFNRMVERLRRNEQIRETFGRYFDPKIVEGMIDNPALFDDPGTALRHDGAVLRLEGIFRAQRGRHAARPGQDHQPLFDHDVLAGPRPPGHPRQIYRRCHHGLLGPAFRRSRRAGRARLPRRGRHDRGGGNFAQGAA